MRKYNINLSIGRVISTNVIIIMGLFFYCCENTIIDNSSSINNEVVINEIYYLSTNIINPEDWVELHNPTNETIAIGLWEFKDENDDNVFVIPEDIVLLSGQYLVLCKNINTFSQIFPSVSNVLGDFVFGLKGEGDQVRLFDSSGLLIDKVEYDDEDPWPEETDGTSFTLELIHPSLDNALGESWAVAYGNGTPGSINSVYNDE